MVAKYILGYLLLNPILQVGNKLLDLHIRLRDLGHPTYLTLSEKPIIECNNTSEAADKEVSIEFCVVNAFTVRVTVAIFFARVVCPSVCYHKNVQQASKVNEH